MEIVAYIVALVGGLIVLGAGGEYLVRGSARLARALGVSAMVVGLTVVAYGTSAPELAVSLQAVLVGDAPLAVGNVVGSNIANVLLIFGAAAAARPFRVSLNLVKLDAPLMVMVSALFVLAALAQSGDGRVERWQGIGFVLLLVAYTYMTYRLAEREPPAVEDEYQQAIGQAGPIWRNLLLIVGGIIGLVIGGRMIVWGASGIALAMGVGQSFVGLTIVAIGTSLPELATSIVAVRQKQPDIAVGNVVGSNLCNILMVIGISATVLPVDVARETLLADGLAMIGACLLFMGIIWSGTKVTRWEGILLLVLYFAYLAWTGQRAVGPALAAAP